MTFKPYQINNAKCIDLSFEGKGVVKHLGDVIFVTGMFPQEEGTIEVSFKKNGQLFGVVKKLDKISPSRIQPKCKVCSSCGGCCLQQLDYQAQLEYKTKKVKEQLRKVGHIDVDVLPCIGMDNPYNYRNKIQVPFRYDNKKNIVFGFFKEGTHQIVPTKECAIEDSRGASILWSIKELMKKHKIQPYDEDSGRGLIRDVLIRTSFYLDQIMVVLVTNGFDFPGRNNFVKDLVKDNPSITTIVQNDNHRHTNVILGEKERVIYGKGFIEDKLCGLTYKISAKSFYQTNPVTTEKLYEYAIKCADIKDSDIVFDAYSGIGTIGLTASKNAKQVIAAEIVKEAVIDARENAKRNGVSNIVTYEADATDFIIKMAKDKAQIDVLIMDPPRKGSTEEFINAVKRLKPSRVVYVSCDPSSLARDLKLFVDTYSIQSVQPFDMFPHTSHVETAVCLSKNNMQPKDYVEIGVDTED